MSRTPVEIKRIAEEVVNGETIKKESKIMDFNSKKFWVFVGIAAIVLVGMIIGRLDFQGGLEYIVGIASGWGILDTAAKFAKPKTNGVNNG